MKTKLCRGKRRSIAGLALLGLALVIGCGSTATTTKPAGASGTHKGNTAQQKENEKAKKQTDERSKQSK